MTNTKIIGIAITIIAIIAITGILLVSTNPVDDSNIINYHGFEFIIPEGFVNKSKITNDTEFILNSNEGKEIEIRTGENITVNTSSKPTTLVFNGINFNKYKNMQIAGSIEYINGEFVVTSYINVTVYNFKNNSVSFYILIEEGISNPDEIVHNMTAKNT